MIPPTRPHPGHFHLTAAPSADRTALRLEIRGYLDYDSSHSFLTDATALLPATLGLRTLRVNCAGLDGIDSTGLVTLLMLHRRTTAAGVRLHLEDRPSTLDRMLTITGTRDHLVPEHRSRAGHQPDTPHRTSYGRTVEDGAAADHAGPHIST